MNREAEVMMRLRRRELRVFFCLNEHAEAHRRRKGDEVAEMCVLDSTSLVQVVKVPLWDEGNGHVKVIDAGALEG